MSDHKFTHYIITHNVQGATDALETLKDNDINDNNIGVVSKDSEIALADLPQADLSEKSELPEALKRGALLGSGSGLLAGVLISVFPAAGLTFGGAALLGMTAGGAAFGAWAAGMIGISENSDLVQEFEQALDDEKTLIFCTLSDNDFKRIENELTQQTSVECGKISER